MQRYCKVAAKQEALRSRLRRTPTVPELAAHLGTEDVESIEQLLDTGKDCKDLMMHANTRLVVSIAKAANRTREVNLTVRPLPLQPTLPARYAVRQIWRGLTAVETQSQLL